MTSSDQYTAKGSNHGHTLAGFFTDSNDITYGVNVQGHDKSHQEGCGVYAESLTDSPGLRRAQQDSRSGVWGVGDHYGVYGAGGNLYQAGAPPVDTTPPLSPDLQLDLTLNPPPIAAGSIGVVGASVHVPGVVGASGLTGESALGPGNTFSRLADGTVQGVFDEVVSDTSVGVLGLSTKNFGAAGINVDGRIFEALAPPGPGTQSLDTPAQINAVLTDDFIDSRGGVLGWSMNGRGGVFGSATPVPFVDGAPEAPQNQGLAQVRLLPGSVKSYDHEQGRSPADEPLPMLPATGQAGDLIAVIVNPVAGEAGAGLPAQPPAQLWFCINSGPNPTLVPNGGTPEIPDDLAATWAQVSFSRTVRGAYVPPAMPVPPA